MTASGWTNIIIIIIIIENEKEKVNLSEIRLHFPRIILNVLWVRLLKYSLNVFDDLSSRVPLDLINIIRNH